MNPSALSIGVPWNAPALSAAHSSAASTLYAIVSVTDAAARRSWPRRGERMLALPGGRPRSCARVTHGPITAWRGHDSARYVPVMGVAFSDRALIADSSRTILCAHE